MQEGGRLTIREWFTRILDSPLEWLLNPPGATPAPIPEPEPTPEPTPSPTPEPEPTPSPVPHPPTDTAYYDFLQTLPQWWKGLSFRPKAGAAKDSPHYEKQLLTPNTGGYAYSNSAPLQVLYDQAADAARIVIPAFSHTGAVLAEPLTDTSTRMVPKVWSSGYVKGRQLKIGAEIVTIVAADASTITPRGAEVARAQYGTTAVPHAAGTPLATATNSLANGIRFPLMTENGHAYFFVWDVLYTQSYVGIGLTNHKAFQFGANKSDDQWLEVQTRFDGGSAKAGRHPNWNPAVHVAGLEIRSYNSIGGPEVWTLETANNKLGPGVTSSEPIMPKISAFNIHPDRWTRLFVKVEQRANNYDLMSFWVADEETDAVQIYRDIPVSVENSAAYGEVIINWWLEMNTSTSEITPGRATDFRDLVSYIKDFGALKGVGDVTNLLQRPKRVG